MFWKCGEAYHRLIEASRIQAQNAAPSLLASTTNLMSLVDGSASSPTAPTTASASAGSTRPFDAAIAIGCLIKGSTMHFEYICEAVTQGLMRVQLDLGTPVVFGVLTALTDDQALERAGLGRGANGKGHSEFSALSQSNFRPRRRLRSCSRRAWFPSQRVGKGRALIYASYNTTIRSFMQTCHQFD